MRSLIRGILFTGVMLLLLSALVVSTESTDAEPPEINAVPVSCRFALPTQNSDTLAASISQNRTKPDSACIDFHTPAGSVPSLVVCDANGRPVINGRYNENVYTLFEADKAAG